MVLVPVQYHRTVGMFKRLYRHTSRHDFKAQPPRRVADSHHRHPLGSGKAELPEKIEAVVTPIPAAHHCKARDATLHGIMLKDERDTFHGGEILELLVET